MNFGQFIIENIWVIPVAIIVLFIIVGIMIANFSMGAYISAFEKYQEEETSFWGTAFEFGLFLSKEKFNNAIKLTIGNENENHYTPYHHLVTLSPNVAHQNNIAGIGVVAHEFGHAIQHYYSPDILIKNAKLNNNVKTLGKLNWIIVLLTIALSVFVNYIFAFVGLGVIFINFIVALALKYSTIKLEKDASKKAIEVIESLKFFKKSEISSLKKFMTAAKRTYVADFFKALLGWTGLVGSTKYFG